MKISTSLAGWNALLYASIVMLAASLGVRFLLPAPIPTLNAAQRAQQESKVVEDADAARLKSTQGEAMIVKYVWPGDAKLAEAQAMALVTKIANTRAVSLGAFRPQKSTEDSGLRRLPFTLSLEGPFPDVIKFINELETPGNRLAVRMLQLSATDGSTDHVSATMTVVAFQELKKPDPNASKVAAGEKSGQLRKTEPNATEIDSGVPKSSPSSKNLTSAPSNLNKPKAGASQQG